MKKFIAGLFLFSFLVVSQPGYSVDVPLDSLVSWEKKLLALQVSLTSMEQNLKGSQTEISTLRIEISSLKSDIETWQTAYQDLLTDSEMWKQDWEASNQKLMELENSFETISTDFQSLRKKYEKLSKQLRGYQTATIVLGSTTALAILTIVLMGVTK